MFVDKEETFVYNIFEYGHICNALKYYGSGEYNNEYTA